MGARVVDRATGPPASERARREHRAGDLVVASGGRPSILRRHSATFIALADADGATSARFERLWVLSIRGHRAPERRPRVRPS
ncbi:MAG: hypothetical protein M5U28_05540 [Sandaracinaceae bacterium]|nr:hypothetical protein [Sandaracinaceae bacterium]